MNIEEINEWEEPDDNTPYPEVEPEICGKGQDGIECDPQWDGEIWFCSTCNKHI